ncbi:hypothetical protein [Photobacterium ganghwense]|uniref:hypothetical protein n=1 Tax=Photobacterium ganghwense TaxID=320778 RepID=UPI0039EE5283
MFPYQLNNLRAVFEENERLLPLIDTTSRDKDEITSKIVGISRCKDDGELFFRKWYDYRFLHPLDATAYFAECYMKAYSQVMLMRGREDYKSAPFRTGIKRKAIWEQSSRTVTSLWKARQMADKLRAPYDLFCFSIIMDTEGRGRLHLATPAQLYQAELIDNFKQALAGKLRTGLMVSEEPYFKASNFCQCPVQEEYQKFVIAQIKMRGEANQDLSLRSAIYTHEAIPRHLAMKHFPEATVLAADKLQLSWNL